MLSDLHKSRNFFRLILVLWTAAYLVLFSAYDEWFVLYSHFSHSIFFPLMMLLLWLQDGCKPFTHFWQSGVLFFLPLVAALAYYWDGGIFWLWFSIALTSLLLVVRLDSSRDFLLIIICMFFVSIPWPEVLVVRMQELLAAVAITGVDLLANLFMLETERLGAWIRAGELRLLITPGCSGLQLLLAGLLLQLFLFLYWQVPRERWAKLFGFACLILILHNILRILMLLILGETGQHLLALEIHPWSSEVAFFPAALLIVIATYLVANKKSV